MRRPFRLHSFKPAIDTFGLKEYTHQSSFFSSLFFFLVIINKQYIVKAELKGS